jgi:hypothetical protein
MKLFQNFSFWNSFLRFSGKTGLLTGFSKSLFHRIRGSHRARLAHSQLVLGRLCNQALCVLLRLFFCSWFFEACFYRFGEKLFAEIFKISYDISMFPAIVRNKDKNPGSRYTLSKTNRVKYPIAKFPLFYTGKLKSLSIFHSDKTTPHCL